MTRDADGKIVEQCEKTYQYEANHVRCVKESGHDGEHKDARGNWNEAAEQTGSKTVPAGEDRGRDGDIGNGDSS